jgi:hypothetical protein
LVASRRRCAAARWRSWWHRAGAARRRDGDRGGIAPALRGGDRSAAFAGGGDFTLRS